MLRFLVKRSTLIAVMILFTASSAVASPALYLFTSGTVQLRVTRVDTGASVLSVPSPIEILLGGSQVLFDPASGTNGTILSVALEPTGSILLDLGETEVALDTVTILNAMLTNDVGATADLTAGGSFMLDTLLTADVSGVFA